MSASRTYLPETNKLLVSMLTSNIWSFGALGSEPLTRSFQFGRDGTIEGYYHPNERTWRVEGDRLLIFTESGNVLWASTEIKISKKTLVNLEAPDHPHTYFQLSAVYDEDRSLNGSDFLFPKDLSVSPDGIRRVLIVGSCLSEFYVREFSKLRTDIEFDYVIFNSASDLPEQPPRPASDYDFQYLQIPLRSVLTDAIITGREILDPEFLYSIFENGMNVIDAMLEGGLLYAKRDALSCFVCNFIVPQNHIAASVDRRGSESDLNSIIRRLNEYIIEAVGRYNNVNVLDVDGLAGSLGKRFVLDDITGFYTHGSVIEEDGRDYLPGARIEPLERLEATYPRRIDDFTAAVLQQCVATFRTLRQLDQVKAVIFDLDNTLWRGQIAEDYRPDRTPWPRGGWQIGIWEAIQQLRARGILTAIASKNDESVVRAYWNNVMDPPFLSMNDFSSIKINWRPKADNIADILEEFNLTPHSVLFVDDNPVERDAAERAFPGLRTLGSNPYIVRRVLLWAPETQIARLTRETVSREATIRAQIGREKTRSILSRADFLMSLGTEVSIGQLLSFSQAEAGRVIELINKTNQFNTTGERWQPRQLIRLLEEGGSIYFFSVRDKFAEYGLVGVIICDDTRILQFVMSCRVMGMDVENAAICFLVGKLVGSASSRRCDARMKDTDSNQPCRDVYMRCGFKETTQADGFRNFESDPETRQVPSHIKLLFVEPRA